MKTSTTFKINIMTSSYLKVVIYNIAFVKTIY